MKFCRNECSNGISTGFYEHFAIAMHNEMCDSYVFSDPLYVPAIYLRISNCRIYIVS